MASGFWKGLLHGAVVSVIGLGALSLLAPVSSEDGAEESETATETQNTESMSDAVSPAPDTKEAPPTADAETGQADAPDTRSDDARPQAASVDLPTGSEFGRGSDSAPQAPADLSRHSPEDQPSTLAVTAPADETVPARALPSDMRPEAGIPTQSDLPEPEATPGFELPERETAPPAAVVPGLASQEVPDSLPELIAPAAAAPEEDEPDSGSETAERENATPALPAPSLNLSTPPDLSDLRALERE